MLNIRSYPSISESLLKSVTIHTNWSAALSNDAICLLQGAQHFLQSGNEAMYKNLLVKQFLDLDQTRKENIILKEQNEPFKKQIENQTITTEETDKNNLTLNTSLPSFFK